MVDCFRLHMVMNSLSQAALKGYKENGIVKLLDIGDHLSRIVFKDRLGSRVSFALPLSAVGIDQWAQGVKSKKANLGETDIRLTLERLLQDTQGRHAKIFQPEA